jgi:hypothetical protein
MDAVIPAVDGVWAVFERARERTGVAVLTPTLRTSVGVDPEEAVGLGSGRLSLTIILATPPTTRSSVKIVETT